MKNIFIEGIPGSGKTTLVKKLAECLPDYKAVFEGEVSPVELAWCAYMDRVQYAEAKQHYPQLAGEMDDKARMWQDRIILPYTNIQTAENSFGADMEKYEIYSGRKSNEEFRSIILKRFEAFRETGYLLECSLFQNIVDELLLYQGYTTRQVVDFYREIFDRCDMDALRVVRLVPRNAKESLEHVRQERVNEQGVRVWEQAVVQYMAASPYGKEHGIRDFDDLCTYYQRRMDVEQAVFSIMPAGTYMDVVSREYAAPVLAMLLNF